MTKRSTAGLAAVACLFGSLACASGMAKPEDTTAAARDTSQAVEPPPGYSGMERDTTGEEHQPTAVDTFLNTQGTGVPTDTAGYSGIEHPDTSGAAAAGDTSGMTTPDTSAMPGMDTTAMPGMDTTSQQ